jgi:coenzyme F420-reducing hydrogenase alpha subunit
MARDHGDLVRNALTLKKAGNELMRLLGGREIHPVSVRAGGFYSVPTRAELAPMAETLKRARDIAVELVRWTARLPFPDFEQDYEFVALRHRDEYPLNEGRIVSSRGINIEIPQYESEFEERHVEHSTRCTRWSSGGAYHVGPLARYALNSEASTYQGSPRGRLGSLRNPSRASSCAPSRSFTHARRCGLSGIRPPAAAWR